MLISMFGSLFHNIIAKYICAVNIRHYSKRYSSINDSYVWIIYKYGCPGGNMYLFSSLHVNELYDILFAG